ncbi:MAG TPA: hypothetical protein PKC55_09865 [Dysgonomonas sp.]|uniref:hypothetical protein n=1 Tax=unclassified Dysgonomonas TaxID=2630389 RepID=UPI0025BBFD77|nr:MULTISPECIES: hypothetical protein [unclassified Dysgonomonas]HML65123.1 hypothetical protein [Dysgonomonas sp.]
MKSEKALSAASYPSRIFKNDVTIKCPDCMVLCSGGCLMVAANSKNKETTTSLFFSRRQSSKVIARVTRKSLRTFSDNLRAYLALAGGCDHAEDKSGTLRIYHPLQNTLTLVACSEVTWQPADFAPDGRKRSGLRAETPLYLPVVASVTSRSDIWHMRVFQY